MNRKIVRIGKKTFLVDEKGTVEEVDGVDPPEGDGAGAAGGEGAGEGAGEGEGAGAGAGEAALDAAAQKAADAIMAALPIDKLTKAVEKLGENSGMSSMGKKIIQGTLTKEMVGKMETKDKIVKFFQACVTSDITNLKALSEGTDGAGGFLVPDEFRAEIIRDIQQAVSMRGLVRVVTMTRDVMNIPTVTSGPIVTWTQENAIKSTSTAQFGQATITAKKMAAIMYASDELVEDSQNIDVVNLIVELFSEAIQREEDRVVVRGNGTTEPTGLTTALTAAAIASVVCAGNLDFDNMINLEYLLDAKYSPSAVFLAHRNNIKELRKIKDGNGRYLWQEPVAVGQPATFHGYPVIEQNDLPEATIFFGDFKRGYWLGDRRRMSVKISNDTETAFTRDQTAIRVVERIGGNVVLGNAIKALTNIP